MTSQTYILTPHDAYVLARALVGLDWKDVPLSPVTGLLLAQLDPTTAEDAKILRRILAGFIARNFES